MYFFKTQNLRIVIKLLFIFTIINITFYDTVTALSEKKLIASDGAQGDWFGYSVSIFENYAIIGAPNDSDNGSGSGSAYIFHYNGINWGQHTKLNANDGKENDTFGYAVAISENYAIVGAPKSKGNIKNSGSAYIFSNSEGSHMIKLIAYDGKDGDLFGNSVAISGNYAIVGAPYDDDKGTNSGSVYINYYVHYRTLLWTKQT